MPRSEKEKPLPDLLTQSGAARLIGCARQAIAGKVARGELVGRTDVVAGLLLITRESALAEAERVKSKSGSNPAA